MPGVGATDPADLEARARAQLGLSRQLQVERRVPSHPGRGGSPGYPVFFRLQQLDKRNDGEDTDASRSSIWRWANRHLPYRITGNKQRSTVVGVDMVNLVLMTRWLFFCTTRAGACTLGKQFLGD